MNLFKIKFPKQVLVLIIFSVVLIIARVFIFNSLSLVYMLWNIFLAVLPFLISSILLNMSKEDRYSLVLFITGLILWLVLLPNAPYLVTDLIHIGVVRAVPAFYDSILLFSTAWVGMILGMNSIFHIEQIIKTKYSIKITNTLIAFIIFLTSFGVYLGRFLRFNSWDIFINHFSLLHGVFRTLSNTTDFLGIYFYLPLIFFFLYSSYFAWRYTQKVQK